VSVKRRVSNPLALVVLSLLCERPMHPYEIAAQMRHRGLHENIRLNYGSLYSVVEVLQREALIVAHGTERAGRLPERTVYAVTDAGRAEFLAWLRTVLRAPIKEYPQFTAGLSLVGHLSPDETISLLTERAGLLDETIRARRANVEALVEQGLSRLFLVEEEYGLTILETDATWVRRFIGEIEDGTFTEAVGGVRTWRMNIASPLVVAALEGLEVDN
jgi:DNA-binding PadR family transcriptional regulator